MASNKHWPSMFKSKPHQWNHDSQISSNGSGRALSTIVTEERSNPDPKPRWNPKPEQVRILEAIFHSGMVNPPRDEIRRIRNQLCEFGQVGDANVFYWFQNRKSRSKNKKLAGNKFSHFHHSQPPMMMRRSPLSTSSSSSERSAQNSADKALSLSSFNVSSPTASVNQPFLQGRAEFLAAPFLYPPPPPQPAPASASFESPEFGFPDPPADGSLPTPTGLFLGDLLQMNHAPAPPPPPTKKAVMDDDISRAHKVHNPLPNFNLNPIPTAAQTVSHAMTTFDHLQGLGEPGPMKLTVFINDVAFEVTGSGFNVREAFGDDAMLLHHSGQPVLTNDWGNTVYPLQHGASYYLIRTLNPSPNETNFHNLV